MATVATTIDDLLAYVFEGQAPSLTAHVAGWMMTSKRFTAFIEMYRDKIRKKRRGIRDAEGLRDLEVELVTAYLLLGERRFTLTYEQYGAIKQRGADFTVVFKGNLQFNVEVKRLRLLDATKPPTARRYLDVVCDKADQMSPAMINLLLIAIDTPSITAAELVAAMLFLRERCERKDDLFFVRRGFHDAREFLRQYRQLSGILLCALQPAPPHASSLLWTNPLADRPLPREISTILQRWNTLT